MFSSQDVPPAAPQPPPTPHSPAAAPAGPAAPQTAALHRPPGPPVQQSKNCRNRSGPERRGLPPPAPGKLAGHLREHHYGLPRVAVAAGTASKVNCLQRHIRQHCYSRALRGRPAQPLQPEPAAAASEAPGQCRACSVQPSYSSRHQCYKTSYICNIRVIVIS